jgi:ABC-2 type transport system permease protein
MSVSRTLAIVLRQYYLIRGTFARFLPLFAWVAIDMLLWGFLSRYLESIAGSGLRFVPRLLGAVLLWDFLVRVAQGVTTAFLEDVWSRNFLNFFATPLTMGEYLGGLMLTSIATSLVGLLVMLVMATAIFGLPFLALGVLSLPYLLILFLCGISLGVFGAGLVLRLGPASEWFIWMIPATLAPFSAVFYPLDSLPLWMRAISHAVPPSYVFEGLRMVLSGGHLAAGPLLAGGALTLAYAALAIAFFRATYRHAIRTGLIARYSAESVA